MSEKPPVAPVRTHGSPHAIELVLFAIELTAPIDSSVIEKLLKESSGQIRSLFPDAAPREVHNFSFTIDRSQPQQTPPPSYKQGGISGVVWETWIAPDQIDLAFHINANQLLIADGKYSRWATEWEKALVLLSSLTSMFEELGQDFPKISSLTLQYNDAFIVSDLSTDWQKLLFRKDSGLIPDRIFNMSDIWHLHQGYLEQFDGDWLLTNTRIDVTRSSSEGRVSIISNHRAQTEDLQLDRAGLEYIGTVYGKMHLANKHLLGELLCPEIQNTIGLNHAEHQKQSEAINNARK